jgi:hypothetical protein
LALPATGASLRRDRRRSLTLFVTGLLLLLVATGMARVHRFPLPPGTDAAVFGPPIALILLGTSELVRVARVGRCVALHPWRSYTAVLDITPEVFAVGRPLLTVTDEDRRRITHYVTGWSRHRLLGRTREVWIAGDPHGACVMSPPGGERLLWLKPIGFVTRFRLGRFDENRTRNDQQGAT